MKNVPAKTKLTAEDRRKIEATQIAIFAQKRADGASQNEAGRAVGWCSAKASTMAARDDVNLAVSAEREARLTLAEKCGLTKAKVYTKTAEGMEMTKPIYAPNKEGALVLVGEAADYKGRFKYVELGSRILGLVSPAGAEVSAAHLKYEETLRKLGFLQPVQVIAEAGATVNVGER